MSIQAMHSAATGMEAFLFNLDTVANNLANAGTTSFKRSRVNFEDLFYQQIKLPGAKDSVGKLTPTGIAMGMGTRIASTDVDFSQGSTEVTDNELDMVILGDGFFQVQDGQEILYTRAGSFTKNATGDVVMSSANKGRLLEPPVQIPQDALNIIISPEGLISVQQAGTSALTDLGTIQLARFINPKGLIQVGENLFRASDASGTPLLGQPGLDGRGSLKQKALEISNVKPVRELIELIKTQRNFELNSQVIQAADQTLQLIGNLRRF